MIVIYRLQMDLLHLEFLDVPALCFLMQNPAYVFFQIQTYELIAFLILNKNLFE